MNEVEHLEHFLQHDVAENCQEIIDEWQEWRQNKLWTLDVNEMFKVNQVGIKALMEAYQLPPKRIFTQEAAIGIFCKDTDLLLEKDAEFCFGMSKMINIKDTSNHAFYNQIQVMSEFMEMIARVAEMRVKMDPDIANMTLVERIEIVLDRILELVNHKTIIPQGGGDEEQSMSDEDY